MHFEAIILVAKFSWQTETQHENEKVAALLRAGCKNLLKSFQKSERAKMSELEDAFIIWRI